MAMRLMMVGCFGSTEGPWTIAKGNEKALEIIHLLEGERIELELESQDATHTEIYYRSGFFPLPQVDFGRYRVVKKVDDGVIQSPTTVRMQLNGVANS